MKLFRRIRIASLSRAEAGRAEADGGIRPGLALSVQPSDDRYRADYSHPGRVEIMLVTGVR